MDNIKSYIVSGLMLMAGLMPSINYSLPISLTAKYWHWWVLMAGFLGFYTMFLRVPLIVKFTAVATFILCFFSAAPSISFTQYMIVVFCCYFYILCVTIKDYNIIFKFLQCLLFFNLLFFILQYFHKDSLLNFGMTNGIANYGIIGQSMQSGSFIAILSAALLPYSAYNITVPFITSFICNSAGSFLAITIGTLYYLSHKISRVPLFQAAVMLLIIFIGWMYLSGKFNANIALGAYGGRLGIWIDSIRLSLERPLAGYGIATYKIIYPQITKIYSVLDWKVAHNTWIQLVFETGFVFASIFMGYFIYLVKKIHDIKNWECIAGLLIIGTCMMFHFAERNLNTVLIIIFFFAYCQNRVYLGGNKNGAG